MSDSEALQPTDPASPPAQQAGITNSVSEVKEVAAIMAKSGFFEDAKSASQAAVKIMAGRELGIPEMAAMRGVYVANGNTELSGPLMAALIKRSEKYDYRTQEVDKEHAVIAFYENGEEVGTASFSIEDAKRAGIYKEDSAWGKYPSDMVFWRALSRGKRRYCPEIGWGASYVWGEGGGKVQDIRESTQAEVLEEPEENEAEEDEPEEKPQPADDLPFDDMADLLDSTRKKMHAIGKDLYGDEWDEKRAELVEWVTDGRTDSASEITDPEGKKIVAGMEKKQRDERPEMVTDEG